jgi:hypothetical protein
VDRDATRQRPLTVEEAKTRLLEDVNPLGSLPDPLNWLREHPKEAMVAAAVTGIVLGTMPRLRRQLFSLAVDVARVVIRP